MGGPEGPCYQLRRLVSDEPRLAEPLEVHSINAIGERLYKSGFEQVSLAPREIVQDEITEAPGISTRGLGGEAAAPQNVTVTSGEQIEVDPASHTLFVYEPPPLWLILSV